MATGASDTILETHRLTKELKGFVAVDRVNLQVRRGTIHALIGPNGAGKTTLIECLANLRPRTSGTFYEGDEAPAAWDPTRLMSICPTASRPTPSCTRSKS